MTVAGRNNGRRPVEAHEVAHLERSGKALRELRLRAGLSQGELAYKAELSEGMVGRLERGERRTRVSTLDRIALALVHSCPSIGDPDDLRDDLAALMGPALAEPTKGERRIARQKDRRRQRRAEWLKGWMAAETERLARDKAEVLARQMVKTWRETGRWPK